MVKALYARMERYPNEMREERLVYLSTKYEDISIDWYSAQSILEKSGTSVNNMPKTIKDFIETSAGYAFDVRVSAVPSEKAAATYKVGSSLQSATASILLESINFLTFSYLLGSLSLYFSESHRWPGQGARGHQGEVPHRGGGDQEQEGADPVLRQE